MDKFFAGKLECLLWYKVFNCEIMGRRNVPLVIYT